MMKTYQSLQYMKLILTVEVNGVGVECAFKGGKLFPYQEKGSYRTANPAIQKALEEHEHYGDSFKLVKTVEDVKPVEKVIEPERKPDPIVKDTVPTIDVEKPEPTTISPTGEVIVNEVKNGQDAKLYLNKHFDVPFSRLKNTEMTMKESKTANLIFPNWKP